MATNAKRIISQNVLFDKKDAVLNSVYLQEEKDDNNALKLFNHETSYTEFINIEQFILRMYCNNTSL